jgi:hypothetical protein
MTFDEMKAQNSQDDSAQEQNSPSSGFPGPGGDKMAGPGPQEPAQSMQTMEQPEESAPKTFDQLKAENAPKTFDQLKAENSEPEADKQPLTDMQHAAALAEAAGRGATYGISTPVEELLGVSKQDIESRQKALPLAEQVGAESFGTIGSMMLPGLGPVGIVSKAVQSALPIAREANILAKAGRLGLRGAIEMGAFAGGDELSDAFLDKGHDAAAVASHIASAGAIGLLGGAAMGPGGAALEKIQNAKLGEYLDNVAIGMGAAAGGEEKIAALKAMHEVHDIPVPKGIDHGINLYNGIKDKAAGKMTDAVAGAIGSTVGSIFGPEAGSAGGVAGLVLADKYLAPYADKFASKYTSAATRKLAVPAMLRAISIGKTADIMNVLGYAEKSNRGARMIEAAIKNTLSMGGKEVSEALDSDNDKLDKNIENGGINQQIQEMKSQTPTEPQAFAEGGTVQPRPMQENGIAALYPGQNQLLSTAKGRVSNYLNQLRPQQKSKLLYDTDQKDEAAHRTYRNALSVANSPLSVLTHIKNGTITAEHVQHMKSMYPELHGHVSEKLTKKMVENQYDEEKKPNYKVRQGLSLFLGAPLDNTMTPMSIQAAQSIYSPQMPPQAQAPAKNKKGTSSLSKFSKDYQTASQSRESRESKE